MRHPFSFLGLLAAAALAACSDTESNPPSAPTEIRAVQLAASGATVVDVGNDTTAQNETPIAVNPTNSQNFIVGANDWNYNDGCAVNASFDGGKTWTATVPNGFLPGVTKYTNDAAVPGTGTGDFGGDPAVAFGPDGTAYYTCYSYLATGFGSLRAQLLLSTSRDGGKTWRKGGKDEPLTVVAQWDASGITKGSTGQFQDHESIWIDPTDGRIYIAWAQFHGNGSNSPIYVAVSSNGGKTFSTPAQITASTVRSNQDARIVTNGDGSHAYLVFDNGVQGGKGAVMYVSESSDRGLTWSAPVQFAQFVNPVCLFPPFCFNVSGTPFRGPGSYPVPAFDPVSRRLYVAFTDIVGGRAQTFLAFTPEGRVTDPTAWKTVPMAPGNTGDRLNVEMSVERTSGRIDFIAEDRSYTNNTLVDITYGSGSSTADGATFTTQRVTRAGYDPSQYGVPSGSGFRPFIGDYNGIVSLPTKAAFAWTGVGKFYGPPPINLDIFFGSVTP
ncbi:MAG TPA: sialidase family protein [Gemmatimonadaceae bacterium]|nr:sialidase family protein [Gemmatimonadaceae bacterium]